MLRTTYLKNGALRISNDYNIQTKYNILDNGNRYTKHGKRSRKQGED